MIVAVQTGRYVIRDVDSRLAAAATAGAAAGAVGPYADEIDDVLLNVLDLGYNIANAVDTPAAERVAALRGGLRGRDRVAAAHLDLGRSRGIACVGRDIARYFIGDIAEFAVRSLERERIVNGRFTDRVFLSIVAVVRRVTVPTLVSIVLPLFLAVVIPADDRIVAVVQYPVFADRCKSERRFVGNTLFGKCTIIDIITSNFSMVVIQLGISRNNNFTIILDTATIFRFTAVVCDDSISTHINLTAVFNCRNRVILQFDSCIICEFYIRLIRIIFSNAKSTRIGRSDNILLCRITGSRNGQLRTILYVDFTTGHIDTAMNIVLHHQSGTVFQSKGICIRISGNTSIVAADFCIRFIKRQPASYKALIFTVCNVKRGIYYVDFEVVNAIGDSITSIRTINNNRRTFLNIQISKTFICHQCSIRSVLNCQLRAAFYIDDSIGIRINTVGFDGAGAASVQCQHALTAHGNSPLCILISKDYIGIVKRQRSIDIERMISSILLGNGNGVAITVDNNSFFNRANGQRAILTNLNRSAVLCIVDCCIKRIILCTADFRGKRFCRSRGRRAVVLRTVCAALLAAGFAGYSGAAGFCAALAFADGSAALRAAFAGLCVIAASRGTGFRTVFAAGEVAFARVAAGFLRIEIIYYIKNIILVVSLLVAAAFGFDCGIAFHAICGRERGHGQHGEHHQTGESAGEETVISPFHAKTSSACIRTQRR